MGLTLDDWDEMSRKVPALVAVAPSGPYVLPDMHQKGGVPVVMKKIEKYLDLSCLTVTGKTVGREPCGCKGHRVGCYQAPRQTGLDRRGPRGSQGEPCTPRGGDPSYGGGQQGFAERRFYGQGF